MLSKVGTIYRKLPSLLVIQEDPFDPLHLEFHHGPKIKEIYIYIDIQALNQQFLPEGRPRLYCLALLFHLFHRGALIAKNYISI